MWMVSGRKIGGGGACRGWRGLRGGRQDPFPVETLKDQPFDPWILDRPA